MAILQRVLWTVSPLTPPEPWRHCARCGLQRPFRCSGRFRLNANGKRLDAWLIYKCIACDETWNHAVMERRMIRDIDPAMLAGFEANDAKLVRRFSFDVAALHASCRRVDEFSDVAVSRETISETAAETPSVEIQLCVPAPLPLRLDRLLARELKLSRSEIAALSEAGKLTASQPLNKSVRDGTVVRWRMTKAKTQNTEPCDQGCGGREYGPVDCHGSPKALRSHAEASA